MRTENNQVLLLVAALTAGAAFFSLGLGRYSIPPGRILAVMLHPFALDAHGISAFEHHIIWFVRIPRIFTALCAGGALALCGAALQGVFHNPLVDPHIIGVTSGSAFGGALAILLGGSAAALMCSAFFFGLLALLCVYMLARMFRQRNNIILVLSGVIVSGFFSALVSLLQYVADTEEKLPSIVFWLMGSFATADWERLLMLVVPAAVCSYFLMQLRWRINVLSLGDNEANALGMNAFCTRWFILLLCAAIVAAQVAVSGSIGWVGLVVPHLARFIGGVDHRRLLPISLLLGGGFMVVVDDAARMLSMSEIPLGIITAVIGAPLFALLLAQKLGRE